MAQTQPQTLKLISFNICPFVQRSVILLNEKGVDYDLDYIDVKNKPDWFLEISPLGKVPVLVADNTSVFESAVISEYIDETHAPSHHPQDPLQKALHRAWVEFGSTLTMAQYAMMNADNAEKVQAAQATLQEGLLKISAQCNATGPFFSGAKMQLIDTALAPLFMRIDIMEANTDLNIYPDTRTKTWAKALAAEPSVQNSIPEGFDTILMNHFAALGGYLFLTMVH